MSNLIATFDSKKVRGTVKFHQCKIIDDYVWVYFDLYDLPPNSTHAIHIHKFGDKSNGCTSLGPHWNPFNKDHGSIFIDSINRHAGDLVNNFTTDSSGAYTGYYKDNLIRTKGIYSILGRSVVIHDGVDDLGLNSDSESKSTGNAGGRRSCAIIGYGQDSH
jgi:Cu-Zn family superoxide dismutase